MIFVGKAEPMKFLFRIEYWILWQVVLGGFRIILIKRLISINFTAVITAEFVPRPVRWGKRYFDDQTGNWGRTKVERRQLRHEPKIQDYF
jgi:hypothetical protein